MKWEYKLVSQGFVALTQRSGAKIIDDLEKLFNKLSEEGWELFANHNTAICAVLYIFRRKIK